MKGTRRSRKKKLLVRALIILVLYMAASWSAFLLPPRFEIGSAVPEEAEKAVRNYCQESDHLYRYHWTIPANRFWLEPFTHRELRERKIVVLLSPSGAIRAKPASTGAEIWFDFKNR